METIKQRRGYALGVDPGSTTGLTLVRFDLEGGMPGVAWSEQLSWEEAAMQVARVLRRISKMPGVEIGRAHV